MKASKPNCQPAASCVFLRQVPTCTKIDVTAKTSVHNPLDQGIRDRAFVLVTFVLKEHIISFTAAFVSCLELFF